MAMSMKTHNQCVSAELAAASKHQLLLAEETRSQTVWAEGKSLCVRLGGVLLLLPFCHSSCDRYKHISASSGSHATVN